MIRNDRLQRGDTTLKLGDSPGVLRDDAPVFSGRPVSLHIFLEKLAVPF
jgi:hypothetical protein